MEYTSQASDSEAGLDEVDALLLSRLMRDGRATWSDLAVDVGISAPAVAHRVRRLVEQGVIRQFAAWVEPAALAPVTAFVTVQLGDARRHDEFRERVGKLDAVQECHLVSGDGGYLLKVRERSLERLARLVHAVLPELAGPCRTTTTLVLQQIKESPVLPLFEDPAEA